MSYLQKIELIKAKQSQVPTCPNIDYIEQNVLAFSHIVQQFYNPEVHRAITCLLRTFLTKTQLSSGENSYILQEIQKFLKTCKEPCTNLVNYLKVRSSTNNLDGDLLNEAYVGINYLNDLRALTPSFKYVYSFLQMDQTQYLIEESLEQALPLCTVLSSLSADQRGIDVVKSIIFQLTTALAYASKMNVSNFPFQIVVRAIDNAVIPVFLDSGIVYINTLGWIPVFERYHSASAPINGVIPRSKSLYQEQNEIIQYIVSMLNAVNPTLGAIFNCPGPISSDFFSTIMLQSDRLPENSRIISCDSTVRIGTCYTLNEIIPYFTIPYARIDTYVRSIFDRMDMLWYYYETSQDQNIVFIIGPVLVKYAELLQNIYNSIGSTKIKNELFLTPRNLPNLGTSKTGKILIEESLNSLDNRYTDPNFILNFINRSFEIGQILRREQQNLSLPNLQTRSDMLNSIQNIKSLISNINYYETTNRLIEHYREYVGNYPSDLTDSLNEACFLKERYDLAFKRSPGILNKLLTTISSTDDALLVLLYDTYIEDIDEIMETRLQDFQASSDNQNIVRINQRFAQAKIIASDPIALIYP